MCDILSVMSCLQQNMENREGTSENFILLVCWWIHDVACMKRRNKSGTDHASWTPTWPRTRRGTRTPPRNSSPNFRLLAFHMSTLETDGGWQVSGAAVDTQRQSTASSGGSPESQFVYILLFNVKLSLCVAQRPRHLQRVRVRFQKTNQVVSRLIHGLIIQG